MRAHGSRNANDCDPASQSKANTAAASYSKPMHVCYCRSVAEIRVNMF